MFETMIKIKAQYDVTFPLEDLKALNNFDFHDCWCSHLTIGQNETQKYVPQMNKNFKKITSNIEWNFCL